MPKVLFILLAGNLLVHLLMILPASKNMSVKWLDGWFVELFHCNLCLGVWVFFILNCFYRLEILSWVSGVGYIPVVSEAISAAFMSWISYIFLLGLKLRYGNFEV